MSDALIYEKLAEQLAGVRIKDIERHYGDDPNVIKRFLPVILQEAIHDAIETGLGLREDAATDVEMLIEETTLFIEGAGMAIQLTDRGDI